MDRISDRPKENHDASDAELIRDAASDGDAFAELYQRHAEVMLRYFMRRTGDAQTAADLTAETFATAFSSRRSFRDVGAPGRAWLFKIASRQLSRFIRTEQVGGRARRRLGVEPIMLDTDDVRRVEELVDLQPTIEALRAAVNDLPSGQVEAVWLRFDQQLPFADIGRRLGCSEGAARVRVSRALSTLADDLGDLT